MSCTAISSIPSTGDYPIFDEPSIQLIKGVQEGAVVVMADGYARASGKTGRPRRAGRLEAPRPPMSTSLSWNCR